MRGIGLETAANDHTGLRPRIRVLDGRDLGDDFAVAASVRLVYVNLNASAVPQTSGPQPPTDIPLNPLVGPPHSTVPMSVLVHGVSGDTATCENVAVASAVLSWLVSASPTFTADGRLSVCVPARYQPTPFGDRYVYTVLPARTSFSQIGANPTPVSV